MTGFDCTPCTDQAIADGHPAGGEAFARIPAADIIVTVMQTFTVNGQSAAAPVTMGVCYSCRRKQLAPVSKTGLVTA